MAGVPLRREKFGHGHRHMGRIPFEDGDRDWSEASTSPEMQ